MKCHAASFFGMLRVLLLISIAFCYGCNDVSRDDISGDSNYSKMVGSVYATKKNLIAIAIVKEYGRDSSPGYITLVPPPGFSGPEIVFKQTIPAGTKFTIRKVNRVNMLFNPTTEYVVDIEKSIDVKGLEVRLDLSRGNEGSGIDLNPEIYEKL